MAANYPSFLWAYSFTLADEFFEFFKIEVGTADPTFIFKLVLRSVSLPSVDCCNSSIRVVLPNKLPPSWMISPRKSYWTAFDDCLRYLRFKSPVEPFEIVVSPLYNSFGWASSSKLLFCKKLTYLGLSLRVIALRSSTLGGSFFSASYLGLSVWSRRLFLLL